MYYMNLPQNHLYNPALRPSNSFYFGLGITAIGLNLNNNFFNFSDVFLPGRSDSIITFLHPDYDINNFLKKINSNNFLTPDVNVQLFGLGFNAGKDLYVFLDVTERVEGNFSLPGDLIKLSLTGNDDFVGKTLDLGSFDAGLIYFREAGAGFSKLFGKHLRLGIKAKMLFGLAGFSMDNRKLNVTINEDFTHTFNADLTANISGPVNIYYDADNYPDSISFDEDKLKSPDAYLNTKNPGLGVDIGAVYSFSEKFSISAAVTDIGYIKWKDMVTNMKAESEFTFSGFNITDVVNGTKTFEELTDEMLDSLKRSFVVTDNKKPFSTYLAPAVTLGASYNFTRSLGIGVLSHTLFEGNEIREAVTFSANLNAGNSFSASVSYTAKSRSYDNIGVGLAWRLGFLQFYIASNRIPVIWNKIIVDNSSFFLPENFNTFDLRFGLNVAFGNNIKKKSDRPMLKVEN